MSPGEWIQKVHVAKSIHSGQPSMTRTDVDPCTDHRFRAWNVINLLLDDREELGSGIIIAGQHEPWSLWLRRTMVLQLVDRVPLFTDGFGTYVIKYREFIINHTQQFYRQL